MAASSVSQVGFLSTQRDISHLRARQILMDVKAGVMLGTQKEHQDACLPSQFSSVRAKLWDEGSPTLKQFLLIKFAMSFLHYFSKK